MGRLQASSPMSFWENFRSPVMDVWSLFVGLQTASLPPPSYLIAGFLPDQRAGYKDVMSQSWLSSDRESNPSPLASQDKYKVACSPRLAHYTPPGDASRSPATTGCNPSNEGDP
ncbi:hypothetical protein RB195_010393 [Necator americanus]|uniref:Uncharacterized protein n=1 Tax=Necator americanus TaxID=51031 RepID=A0ABR1D108_NECAM